MAVADDIVSPTDWQRQQLPRHLKDRCRVIPDPIDSNLFYPDPQKRSSSPILTYGTRGMEPMRGFPEFIKCLPRVLKKWPALRVEIAGTDSVNYGGQTPKEGSWKKWALSLLENHNLTDRVSWQGHLPLHAYVNWLKKSWCHVYLSEPFVTSWSFIEACHCGIPIVATRSQATEEFSHLNNSIIQIAHTDEDQLAGAINDTIRFSANLSHAVKPTEGSSQIKSTIYPKMTLATLIADVEAATRI